MHGFSPTPTALPTFYLVTSGEGQECLSHVSLLPILPPLQSVLHMAAKENNDYVMPLLKSLQWPVAFRIMSKLLSKTWETSHGVVLANLTLLHHFMNPVYF